MLIINLFIIMIISLAIFHMNDHITLFYIIILCTYSILIIIILLLFGVKNN